MAWTIWLLELLEWNPVLLKQKKLLKLMMIFIRYKDLHMSGMQGCYAFIGVKH